MSQRITKENNFASSNKDDQVLQIITVLYNTEMSLLIAFISDEYIMYVIEI